MWRALSYNVNIPLIFIIIYLHWQCRDYASGVVGGSLCEPLCVRREVEFVRCLGHGVKMHVLQAQWAGNTVVLKTNDLIDNHTAAMHVYWERDRHRVITRDEFIREVRKDGTCILVCVFHGFLCVLCRPTRLCL